jgi:two-component system, LuxR family, response regulator FixJ
MLASDDLEAATFSGGEELIANLDRLEPGCILLDVRMPRMDGFEVMSALRQRGIDWPIIVMTGHGEVPVAVRAMKSGAIDFIEKPFGEDVLAASLERGFLLLDERSNKDQHRRSAQERISSLSGREREVLQGLLAGLPNKLVADRLGISLRTVEMHRANMMDRLRVKSLAEALTLAVQSELPALESGRGEKS